MGGQSHVGNIYGVSQPSPDSERFSDMKIRSPPSQQPEADGKNSSMHLNCVYSFPFSEDVNQLSGKIDSISLSGALALSLDMQQQHHLFGQQQVSVETLQVSSSFHLPLILG